MFVTPLILFCFCYLSRAKKKHWSKNVFVTNTNFLKSSLKTNKRQFWSEFMALIFWQTRRTVLWWPTYHKFHWVNISGTQYLITQILLPSFRVVWDSVPDAVDDLLLFDFFGMHLILTSLLKLTRLSTELRSPSDLSALDLKISQNWKSYSKIHQKKIPFLISKFKLT